MGWGPTTGTASGEKADSNKRARDSPEHRCPITLDKLIDRLPDVA
jgi:hypothetical protein